MTVIGQDIAEVLDEVGTLVNVIKHDGSPTVQEYIDYEVQIAANSPFLTQFMLDCTLAYNTTALPGDIIQFVDDSVYYLLTVSVKERFEQSVVTIGGILYRCNMMGNFSRRSETRDGEYVLSISWPNYETSEPVLLTGLIDYYDIIDREYAQFSVSQDNLHVSGDVDIQVGDRFTNSGGDKYEIKAIAPYRLNNIHICRVIPDSRE